MAESSSAVGGIGRRVTALWPLALALFAPALLGGCVHLPESDLVDVQRYENEVARWRELAQRGFPDARFELDRRIVRGTLSGERSQARRRLSRAQAAGDARAALELARGAGTFDAPRPDDRQMVEWLEQARAAGLAGAEREFALRQLEGRAVTRDVARALESLAGLATAGDAQAAHALGRVAEQGIDGAAPSLRVAAGWYQVAAGLGLEDAQVSLAALRATGRGLPEDVTGGLRELETAARSGQPRAARLLAGLRADPAFAGFDPDAARRWREAVRYFELAPGARAPRFTLDDVNDSQRIQRRLELWSRYARLGDRDAARALGDWYSEPRDGSPPDPARARAHYRTAAESGDALALVALLNLAGSGSDENQVRRWLREAVQHGSPVLRAAQGRELARAADRKSRIEAAAQLLSAARAGESGTLGEAVELLMRLSRSDVEAAQRQSRQLSR